MTVPLEQDKYYHVYNHANGRDELFVSDENYWFFLDKYQYYISKVANTYCYCLLPNHFHFLIQVKSEPDLEQYFRAIPKFKNLYIRFGFR